MRWPRYLILAGQTCWFKWDSGQVQRIRISGFCPSDIWIQSLFPCDHNHDIVGARLPCRWHRRAEHARKGTWKHARHRRTRRDTALVNIDRSHVRLLLPRFAWWPFAAVEIRAIAMSRARGQYIYHPSPFPPFPPPFPGRLCSSAPFLSLSSPNSLWLFRFRSTASSWCASPASSSAASSARCRRAWLSFPNSSLVQGFRQRQQLGRAVHHLSFDPGELGFFPCKVVG